MGLRKEIIRMRDIDESPDGNLLGNALELLLLLIILLLRRLLRAVEPLNGFIDSSVELGLITSLKLVRQLLIVDRITEVVGVRL